MVTRKLLKDRLEYLFNVTGVRYELSCQASGNGKGYSVMLNGSHVMTYGHVPASVLDACITAFAKGFHRALEANSAAISAAPDLYWAARYALADLEGIMPIFDPSGDRKSPAWQTIKELQSAIADAKGVIK